MSSATSSKTRERVQVKMQKSIELKATLSGRTSEVALTSIENDLKDLKAQDFAVERQVDNIDDELKNTEIVQRKTRELGLFFRRRALSGSLQGLLTNNARRLKTAWLDVLHSNISPLLRDMKKARRDNANRR